VTDRNRWTGTQRTMMSRTARFHRLRSALALGGFILLVFFGAAVRARVARQQEMIRVEGLVGRLVSAEPYQLPGIARELDGYPEVAETFLSPLLSARATTIDEHRAQLHARIASVSRDSSLIEPLVEELLTGRVTYVVPIRERLRPSTARLTERFRALLRDDKGDPQRRFRAALALADAMPDSAAAAWTEHELRFVAEQLVSANPEYQPLLRDALRPVQDRLLAHLEQILGDVRASDTQRLGAANAFADYAANDTARLSRLLTVATPEQYAVLYPIVATGPAPSIVADLAEIAATLPPEDLSSVERVPFGQRRANAAVTLLRLGERERALPVFEMTDDPEAIAQFIFRCRPRGLGVDALLECLQLVSHAPADRYPRDARYALLLALGEFKLDEIPASRRAPLLQQLADWYRHDPSSGVHGAAGWLLRQWGQADVVREVDQTPVAYAPDREWFTLAITVTPAPAPRPGVEPGGQEGGSESETREAAEVAESQGPELANENTSNERDPPAEDHWSESPATPLPAKTFYYTFIVFAPGVYTIGSVDDEPGRREDETRHSVKLTRPFALLDREITLEELIASSPQYTGLIHQYDAHPADAGFGAHWYDAVGFCRSLGEQMGLSEAEQAYPDPESLDEEEYPREPDPRAGWAPRNWPVELERRGLRLPTESEWEVASRAGVRTAYGYGSDASLLEKFGWFSGNSGKQVRPPRQLRPGRRGLFDLHGNLFEWTHDWWGAFGSGALTDPVGESAGSGRVSRGGSWGDDEENGRAAYRFTNMPSYRTLGIGLRLALSLPAITP
jgi:formylglycine-generating enzyme required for sulfatase activity